MVLRMMCSHSQMLCAQHSLRDIGTQTNALLTHVHTGHTEVVELLLKRKANPANTNKKGQSVLEMSKPEVRFV